MTLCSVISSALGIVFVEEDHCLYLLLVFLWGFRTHVNQQCLCRCRNIWRRLLRVSRSQKDRLVEICLSVC